MELFLSGTESGVESEVVDLGSIPLKVLRGLNDTVLDRALRHVVEQTGHVWVAAEEEQPPPDGARID
jgi:hypothetical protein